MTFMLSENVCLALNNLPNATTIALEQENS